MNTTDTQFDRLAELTQEAVDALKAAIERAEAAEAECEELKRELSKAWHHMYRTPKIEVVQTETSRLHNEVIELRRHLGKTMSERDSNKELYDAWYRNHLRKLEAVKAERDALQARIDAGVRMYFPLNDDGTPWAPTTHRIDEDTHTGLMIDPQPIAPQWTRADGSTNPRTGERREGLEERCADACRRDQCRESVGPCYTQSDADDYHDNRRDPSGASNRRMNK